jgi:peptidoglycan DL-endopeptidase CwlO
VGLAYPLGGNAIDWKKNWQSHGWSTSTLPMPGAVAWWGTSAGADGHVAYVQAVRLNGSVTIEEYNWGGTHRYDTRSMAAGTPDLYLYPPPR